MADARINPDGSVQSLEDHLHAAADISASFLKPAGLPETGRLLGLLHDIGKYSDKFQSYLHADKAEQDKLRGNILHAKYGARYARLQYGKQLTVDALLMLPVWKHHGVLPDMYSPDGESPLEKLLKDQGEPDEQEIFNKLDSELRREIGELFGREGFVKELLAVLKGRKCADFGFTLRLLYSALIDADRMNAAGITSAGKPDWNRFIRVFEEKIRAFRNDSDVAATRGRISSAMLSAAKKAPGVYRFTIPTGGGKTLAGLRFALHHAAEHGMSRIIYAAPFLSILEQNAEVFRAYLGDPEGNAVVESHSNLVFEDEEAEIRHDRVSESWNAPVVCTTMVQILNAVFSGESRYARRFHQLSDAVILLDEIQSLPLCMAHIFSLAVNYIAEVLHSTVILCSATQPGLDRIDACYGAVRLSPEPELYPEFPELFRKLKRVETEYRGEPMTNERIADTVEEQMRDCRTLLLVVNTKPHAAEMFRLLRERMPGVPVYHLSTNMCPAHRKTVLNTIRAELKAGDGRLIVVSTSLIEAGVDISFECVIRMIASLDSIVQAAGRCNRNDEMKRLNRLGKLVVLENPAKMRLSGSMPEWIAATKTAFRKYAADPDRFGNDMLSPALLDLYFEELYSFEANKEIMKYPVRADGRELSLTDLLGENDASAKAYFELNRKAPAAKYLCGAYETAAKKFRALDDIAPYSAIVPYGEGKEIIALLSGAVRPDELNALLKRAQQYSVNLTEFVFKKLEAAHAVNRIDLLGPDQHAFALQEDHYDSNDLGVTLGEGTLVALQI
jgi:CRISPR-associated endonuclease/helicase Cas3